MRNRLGTLALLWLAGLVPGAQAQDITLTQTELRSSNVPKPPSVKSYPGPVIPGLKQNAIPQGIAYSSKHRKIFVSHYFVGAPSRVSILDSQTGMLVATVILKDPSGADHTGHVGGLAVLNGFLFVASDGHVLQYDLRSFTSDRPSTSVSAVAERRCETNAAFCTSTSELLLVGEFAYGQKYPTPAHHHLTDRKGVRKYAWVCGYKSRDPTGKPTCILSVRQRVQGMSVDDDRVFLSVSYGRQNRSKIVIYRNPIGEPAHKTVGLPNGSAVPLWFLDGNNFVGEIDFPPMSEGIVVLENRLAVLCESGARKYQFATKGPIDRILLLDISRFE